jgi:chaperonin cofactor prefoldin
MNTQTFTITTSSFILHPSSSLLLLAFLLLPHFCFAANTTNTSTGFTQADRERLIRLEATLETFMKATNIRFQELRADMNRRFEAVDKRFEELRADMNRRFEAVDKRFEEMRTDMNRRFEAVDKRFEDINRRFEDINRRFEDINRRFEEMYFFLEIICYTFAAIAIANFGFVFWDRRSLLRPLKQKVNKLEETHVSQEEFTSIKQQLTTVQTRLKNLEELYNNNTVSSKHQTATI